MKQPKYDIFISYRRDGGYDTAKHLYDLLTRDGYSVSFDIDTLRNGDFDTALLNRVDECKDFILILDSHAFDRTLDQDFDPKKDWLRQELAYALKQGKNIIPVFLGGNQGFPDNLPGDIKDVSTKNGPEYNRYYFNDFYKILKQRFLSSGKRIKNKKGIVLLCTILMTSIGCVVYAALHENAVSDSLNVCFMLFSFMCLVAMIVGLSNPKLILFTKRTYSLWYLMPALFGMTALGFGAEEEGQANDNFDYYLHKSEYCLYFGTPKTLSCQDNGGTPIITQFDKRGFVTEVSKGNFHVQYQWNPDSTKVTLLHYKDDTFCSSATIEIEEFSEEKHQFVLGGAVDVSMLFNSNGTLQSITAVNPQSTNFTRYFYSSPNDMFPSEFEQSIGNQMMKFIINIVETDYEGNPISVTRECFGNIFKTTSDIEYY